ncbi:hypothetical protein PSTT_11262 [Puccinia striiformis]|uniref:Uncharacterized protein n=1 Tax=Puccinia striiformis TaxID=27350 RepID=A0A2S4V0Y5_9BASI|nr:hypothetical protein PSTT_11262 [Puccinia striiformis]
MDNHHRSQLTILTTTSTTTTSQPTTSTNSRPATSMSSTTTTTTGKHCSPPSVVGLRPLLLPTAFSPQLPSTPETGPFGHHHPQRKASLSTHSWSRHPSTSRHYRQSSLTSSPYCSSIHSSSSSSSSSLSSASSFSSSSCSSSSNQPSPTTTTCEPPIESTPRPNRSYSTTTVSPPSFRHVGSSALRASSLPDPLTPSPDDLTRRTKRSSISYSKSTPFHCPSISKSPEQYSATLPVPIDRVGSFDPLIIAPEHRASELPFDHHSTFDLYLDTLLAQLLEYAADLGFQDELLGIL